MRNEMMPETSCQMHQIGAVSKDDAVKHQTMVASHTAVPMGGYLCLMPLAFPSLATRHKIEHLRHFFPLQHNTRSNAYGIFIH